MYEYTDISVCLNPTIFFWDTSTRIKI